MKIAIITPTFPPYSGGIGNVAAQHAKELTKLGHQVTVFTPLYQEVKEEISGVEIKRIKPLFKHGNAAFLPKIAKLVLGFDIIHVHYPFFGAAELIWLKSKKLKKAGGKIILHYHMDVVGQGLLSLFFSLHNKFILPKIIKAADKIIVTSFDYAEQSNISYLLKQNQQKFLEVPNGVDVSFFKPEPKDKIFLDRYGIGIKDKVILFVGGLDKAHYFKGVEYLIEAASRLRRASYPWRLVIVGEGDLKSSYQDLASQLGIDKLTIFTGYVPINDLPKHYNLADVVVLPSVDKSEAFGLALVEGMACGKAVVASNLSGVRSVVLDNVCGFLVSPKNVDDLAAKINHILANEQIAEKFGQAGRRRAEEKYSWKGICQQLDALYKS